MRLAVSRSSIICSVSTYLGSELVDAISFARVALEGVWFQLANKIMLKLFRSVRHQDTAIDSTHTNELNFQLICLGCALVHEETQYLPHLPLNLLT